MNSPLKVIVKEGKGMSAQSTATPKLTFREGNSVANALVKICPTNYACFHAYTIM